MCLATRSPRPLAALLALALVPAARAQDAKPPEPTTEVRLGDDSLLKLKLLEPHVEIQIKYGKLTIPFADIRKIEVGHHVTDEMAKQIERAISDLGSPQFRTREEAGVLLLGPQGKSLPRAAPGRGRGGRRGGETGRGGHGEDQGARPRGPSWPSPSSTPW